MSVKATEATALGVIALLLGWLWAPGPAPADEVNKQIARLKDRVFSVRAQAAEALGKLDDKRAVAPLVTALKDPRAEVEAAAARALGQLAKLNDKRVVAPLVTAIGSRDSRVRAAAGQSLGQLGEALRPAVVATLGEILADRPATLREAYADERVVRVKGAIKVLAGIPTAESAKALIQVLDDPNQEVQKLTGQALPKIGAPALAPLLGASKRKHYYLHLQAVYALASLRDPRLVQPLGALLEFLPKIGAPALAPLLDFLEHKEHYLRVQAVYALGALRDPRAVQPLAAMLKDAYMAEDAARSLGTMGPLALEALLAALKDDDARIHGLAAAALGNCGDKRAVPALLETLKDKAHGTREAAAEALGKLRDSRAAPALVTLLKDREGHVQGRARRALEEIGSPAVQPLLAGLKDESLYVRASSAEALAEIRDGRAVAPLIAALKDQDSYVRREAARALGQFDDKQAVEPLTAALKDENDLVRHDAAESLGALGDRRAARSLVAALKDKEGRVREAAAEALERIGFEPQTPEDKVRAAMASGNWGEVVKMGEKAVGVLLEALKDDELQRSASRALGRIGAPAVQPLIEAMAQDDSDVRLYGKWALVEVGAPAVGPLVAALRHKDATVRMQCSQVLRDLEREPKTDPERIDLLIATRSWDKLAAFGATAYQPLLALLKDNHPEVRGGAARALGRLGDKKAVPHLLGTLKDPCDSARSEAAAALGRLAWEPATPVEEAWYLLGLGKWQEAAKLVPTCLEPLLIAAKDEDPRGRAMAIRTLAALKDKRAVDPLIAALKDDSYEVRAAAAIALGECGDKRAVPALIEALASKDFGARPAAAAALGELADPQAVPVLVPLLKDKDRDVQYQAVQALKAIGRPAVEALVAALKDPHPRMRAGAVAILSPLRDPRATRGLVRVLADPSVGTEAARTLRAMGWQPASDSERIHYHVALWDGPTLLAEWEVARKVLLADIRVGEKAEIRNAVWALLRLKRKEILPDLTGLLSKHGTPLIALTYLNHGAEELREPAMEWLLHHDWELPPDGELVPSGGKQWELAPEGELVPSGGKTVRPSPPSRD